MNFIGELPRNCAHCPYVEHDYHFGYFSCNFDDDESFLLDVDDLYHSLNDRNSRCPLNNKYNNT